VSHRDDLDFILGELIGELNAGHTYVQTGESPRVERVPVGTLGAELEADGGRYRIARIFAGRPWNADERSPLHEPGVDVEAGDYLISIDGEDLTADDNPYRLLENKVDVDVRLGVADAPDGEVREVVVRPIGSEVQLRYLDWVERNRRLVDELSDGRVGYAVSVAWSASLSSVAVGIAVGVAVGMSVGMTVGVAVGIVVGVSVGFAVGLAVGVGSGVFVATGSARNSAIQLPLSSCNQVPSAFCPTIFTLPPASTLPTMSKLVPGPARKLELRLAIWVPV
jgi:hypothetical protein